MQSFSSPSIASFSWHLAQSLSSSSTAAHWPYLTGVAGCRGPRYVCRGGWCCGESRQARRLGVAHLISSCSERETGAWAGPAGASRGQPGPGAWQLAADKRKGQELGGIWNGTPLGTRRRGHGASLKGTVTWDLRHANVNYASFQTTWPHNEPRARPGRAAGRRRIFRQPLCPRWATSLPAHSYRT